MNPTPKVTLLTWTQLPLETVFSVWESSKTEESLRTPEQIRDEVSPEEIEKLFKAVILQRIPIGEHIDFVFMIENVSISWREQAVRHRIGVKISPERIGIDIIPDLAESSWWSQSGRIRDMAGFAQRGEYRLPKTVAEHENPQVRQRFIDNIQATDATYKFLVESGIPMEDARELAPLGMHHRISWKLNMAAMQHIVGKRGCWILQLGIWGPVIQGMISELVTKVHPVFSEMVTPPCLKGDEFTGCIYMEECRRRYTGDDALPPCPLHLANHHSPRLAFPLQLQHVDIPLKKEMMKRAEDYKQFWQRDPYSGGRIR